MIKNKILEVFGKSRVVLPVIHVETEEQALRNVEIAKRAGADGVFLINHDVDWMELLEVYKSVRRVYPSWWIGLNFLGQHPLVVFKKIVSSHKDISGIWTDNALISETDPTQKEAKKVINEIARIGWRGLYFGGVAFKYQKEVSSFGLASRTASYLMDVVTTSGPGTGKSADLEKVKKMCSCLEMSLALAVASGATPENVTNYSPVNAFLVNTGISDSFTELNESLSRLFVEKVRGMNS